MRNSPRRLCAQPVYGGWRQGFLESRIVGAVGSDTSDTKRDVLERRNLPLLPRGLASLLYSSHKQHSLFLASDQAMATTFDEKIPFEKNGLQVHGLFKRGDSERGLPLIVLFHGAGATAAYFDNSSVSYVLSTL